MVLISAFPPLTTDLYLPALPKMVEAFNTSHSMVNLTLSTYFIIYAFGLLFWGPLSDKFGRKPIMLSGIGIYVLGSLFCGYVSDIESLIFARAVQAFGGSAVTVVATAIVKDLYDGKEREKIMATILSLVVIAPMVAPVIGALLLKVASWRMIFIALALFGATAALFSLAYKETLTRHNSGSVLRSWGRLGVVLKNPNFLLLLATFSIVPMSMMGFVAASSYIYIDHFGFTEQQFSYVFALNALFASFGPRLYLKVSQRISIQRIISGCFILLTICGGFIFSFGHLSPLLFACLVAPATLATITTRVPGTNLMLEQQQQDTGSAVAVIQFCSMIAGAIGMGLISLETDSLIKSLGMIQIMIGLISGVLWLAIKHRPFVANHISQPAN